MAKLKVPLLSFLARGGLGNMLSFRSRKGSTIAEKKPMLEDSKSQAQLSWRTMFNLCVDLWHELSAAEKAVWESNASPHHMTGYAWYISQCLRPNPGIYLPLAGGTMTGEIAMGTNSIIGLPLPTGSGHAVRKSYVDAIESTHRIGARAYHSIEVSIPDTTWTALAFDSERYDTDNIHDNVVNNSRLTCKTAGKYIITGCVKWRTRAAGWRQVAIIRNGTTNLNMFLAPGMAGMFLYHVVATIDNLAVNDRVELRVYQDSGGALGCMAEASVAPEFAMQRIG